MARAETFSSRWGLIVAALGMAVGTGNMWRFPRIAAQNGGAAFLIPWMAFLLLWSLPLVIAEMAIGRGTRRAPVGALAALNGPAHAWKGGFIAMTSVMILFYYSVVTGWTLKYLVAASTGALAGVEPGTYWTAFTSSWEPAFFHVAAAVIGGLIVHRGVVGGIERASRLLIPSLFALLVLAAGRAVTLPGADRGLEFLFNPDLSRLASYRTWLEALTQSAWSTGAGWGLILTYATYMKPDEDIVLNATTIGFGDNSASLLAGMAILPTVFAVLSVADAEAAMASGNTGLMFIWIPQLFARVPGGAVFQTLFFLALAFAALTSLMAMMELGSRVLIDAGFTRRRAVLVVTAAVVVCGMPSALSLAVFENQDWVWGLALMIAGLFIARAATAYGPERFRTELVNVEGNDLRVGRILDWILRYVIPLEFAVMFGWWLYQAAAVYDPDGWWNPFHVYSVGTCLAQWAIAVLVLRAFNARLASASLRVPPGTPGGGG